MEINVRNVNYRQLTVLKATIQGTGKVFRKKQKKPWLAINLYTISPGIKWSHGHRYVRYLALTSIKVTNLKREITITESKLGSQHRDCNVSQKHVSKAFLYFSTFTGQCYLQTKTVKTCGERENTSSCLHSGRLVVQLSIHALDIYVYSQKTILPVGSI